MTAIRGLRRPFLARLFLLAILPAAHPAAAAPTPEELSACAELADDAARLACFDALVPHAGVQPSGTLAAAPVPQLGDARISPLGNRWAIGVNDTLFDLRPHRPTYILPVRYTSDVNTLPQTPTQPPGPVPFAFDDVEGKFQISFKFKLADFDDAIGASLWAGYTQQSHWQVYNSELSRPFRETNYEPEFMLAFHPDRRVLGLDWRLLNFGLVHQSNGRSEFLSRSWNRVYGEVGFERGDFTLLARAWYRLEESADVDDNPDIDDFLGNGDVVASYALGRHRLSLRGRWSPSTGHGSAEGTWSFPLGRRVYGYAQVFSGYGESMIDYNWKQTTVGAGIALSDWF
jgi:phospholipase A1